MKVAGWIVAIAVAGLCYFVLSSERNAMDVEAEKWRAERDSVNAVNAALMAKVDSLTEAANTHALRSDSLAFVPQYIYIEHAARLTRSASLDSLGLLLGADPFLAVPDPLNDHDEP